MKDTEHLLTYKEVLRATGFRSRTSIWNHVRDRSFPAPLRIGNHGVRWRASDIMGWIESLPEQRYRELPHPPASLPERPGLAAEFRRRGDALTP